MKAKSFGSSNRDGIRNTSKLY